VDYEFAYHTTNVRQIEADAPSTRFRREWQTRRDLARNEARVRRDLARIGETAPRVA
jgi:hypothetical protein